MGKIEVKLSGKRKLKIIQAFAVYVLLGFNKMPIGELSLGTFVGRPNRKKNRVFSATKFCEKLFLVSSEFSAG